MAKIVDDKVYQNLSKETEKLTKKVDETLKNNEDLQNLVNKYKEQIKILISNNAELQAKLEVSIENLESSEKKYKDALEKNIESYDNLVKQHNIEIKELKENYDFELTELHKKIENLEETVQDLHRIRQEYYDKYENVINETEEIYSADTITGNLQLFFKGDRVTYNSKYNNMVFNIVKLSGYSINGIPLYSIYSPLMDLDIEHVSELLLVKI